MSIESIPEDSYESTREQVRMYVAHRLREVVESTHDWVVNVPEPSASLIQAYTNAVKELGRVYRVFEPPASEAGMLTVEQAEKMRDAAVIAAVSEALEAERIRVAGESKELGSRAREEVRGALRAIKGRAS